MPSKPAKQDAQLSNQARSNAAIVVLKRALKDAIANRSKGQVSVRVPYKDGALGEVIFEKTEYLSELT